MRKFTTLGNWVVAALLLLPLQMLAQEFKLGAKQTGGSTVGLSLRYDGNFAAGVVYNHRDFGDFDTRAIDYIGQVEYRFGREDISTLHVQFATFQMIANGFDDISEGSSDFFEDGFAMGCRLGIAWDKSFGGPNMGDGCNSRLSLKGGFTPGYNTDDSFVGANIKADLVSMYIGQNNDGYRRAANTSRNIDWRFVEATTLGIHYDWVDTPDDFEPDAFHLAVDLDYATYLNVGDYKGWDTWKENEGTPPMQRNNLGVDLYLNYRFD